MKHPLLSDTICQFLINCLNTQGKCNVHKFKKEMILECKEFMEKYNLDNKQLYYIFNHNLSEIPKCKICGKQLKNFEKTYCSVECFHKDNEVKEKRVNSIKKTLSNLYGENVTNVFQLEEVKEKSKNTLLQKHNETNLMKIPEIREKIIQTNNEKYNADFGFGSQVVRDKSTKTIQEKYNVDNVFQSPEIQEKIKHTNKEKYNSELYAQSDDFKKKQLFSKRKKHYTSFLQILEQTNFILLSTFDEFCTQQNIKLQHSCGYIFEISKASIELLSCPVCNQNIGTSEKERSLFSFIQLLYSGKINFHDRQQLYPQELDVYIPEYNLAFEFNGTYWHREGKINKNYHQEKTLKCKEKGIELVHIFEYEWDTQRYKIENLIKSKLHIFSKRIYARNCIVKEISSQEYITFLDSYHLQNSINSSIRYGLFYNNEIISVIGFGKSRFKKDEIELHRYCVKPDYIIVGGFSKLIKHSGIDIFITYVDLSHFSGKGYLSIGFKQLDITSPNYKWIKRNKILNRISTQKHKLSSLLEQYDPELSENDNMLLNGYMKIYDAGNLKLEYKN